MDGTMKLVKDTRLAFREAGLRYREKHLPTPPPARPRSAPAAPPDPRPLTDADVEGFMVAADTREPPARLPGPASTEHERDKFVEHCLLLDPHRMKRFRKDLQWLQRQAGDFGLGKDDIRWLL